MILILIRYCFCRLLWIDVNLQNALLDWWRDIGHGLGGNHAIRARGCHVSSASCAWIGLCSCTLQVWADFCALKDTSSLVVPKALNVRNLQKGKLELIFQGWMFFFRCQTSFREVLASEIWLRVKCPVGDACGLEGHFFSHPNLLDVCKELVGWINECQEEVVIFSFQTRNDSWIFHTFAKVWSPNWKMGMRAISSCSSLSMGVSWNRHQSTGRLPISMPQAVYLILPKAEPNSMKCWNMLKTHTIDTWHLTHFHCSFVRGRGPMSIATAAAGNLRPLFVLNLVCPLIKI